MSETRTQKVNEDWLDDYWLAEQNKSKFVKKLEIIAGTLFIVLLVSALVVSPYLAIAAMLSLAIPKLGEKLYSTFFSMGNEMNPTSQATQEKQTFANDRETEKADQVKNVTKKNEIKYGPFYKRMPEGLLTEQQIVAQGKETDFTTAGKFIKG